MQELDRLRIVLEGDASPYLSSLREAEGATRKTATRLEGDASAATKAVAQSQTQLAASYVQTGQAAAASATQQSGASAKAAAASAAHADAMKRGAAITAASMTPLEQFRARVAELNKLQAQGAITSETHGRALKKAADGMRASAAQQAAQQAASATKGEGGGLGGMMGAARSVVPYVAMAAAAMKVADAIADWATNTRKFRAEAEAAKRSMEALTKSIALDNESKLGDLRRNDRPLQERKAEIDAKLKASQAELERRQKLATEAREQVRADEENIGVKGLIRDGSDNPLLAGAGLLKWAKRRLTGGRERAGNKAQSEAFDELEKKQQELVDAQLKLKHDLEQELKSAVFQQQSQSREGIDLARIPEHLRGGEKLRRMGASEADVKETQRLATDEMTTKFSADTDKSSRMLKLQAQNLTATSNELRVMEMALEGASEKQLEMAKASAQANKQAELQLTIAQTNKQLREQIDVLGKSASFAQLYGLKVKGASDAQLAMTKSLGQQLRGKELQEQFMSPQQKYIKSMNELNELLQAGAVDQLTYARAAKDARKQLEGQRQELQAIQGAASGSAEALGRFNEFQDRIKIRPLPGVEDMQRVVQAQQFRQAGGVLQGQAGGLGVGGVVAGPQAMERNPPMMNRAGDNNEVLKEIRDILRQIAQRPAINLGLGLGGN